MSSEGRHKIQIPKCPGSASETCSVGPPNEMAHAKVMGQHTGNIISFLGKFMVRLWKRYVYKLCRIILLHFGLVPFRFGHGKDRTLLIFMISAFLDVSLSTNTNIIYLFLRHQDTPDNPFRIVRSKFDPLRILRSVWNMAARI